MLRRESWLGYEVVGALRPPTDREETRLRHPASSAAPRTPPWSSTTPGRHRLRRRWRDRLRGPMRELAWELEQHDVQVVVAPTSPTSPASGSGSARSAGLPLMHIDPPRAAAARGASASSTSSAPRRSCWRSRPLLALRRAADQAARRRPGPVPPDPGRPRRRGVRLPQVPHHGASTPRPGRRAPGRGRRERAALQDEGRPADHQARPVAAPLLGRRAAPAVQRAPSAT